MEALRGLPFLVREGMRVALTPPARSRDRFMTVEEVSGTGETRIVRLSGLTSMTDAEEAVSCYLLVREDDLDLDPLVDSFEHLEGRLVVDDRFGELGTIQDIMLNPANDVWVVDGASYGEVLIPVIEQVVQAIPHDGPIPVHIMDGLIASQEE